MPTRTRAAALALLAAAGLTLTACSSSSSHTTASRTPTSTVPTVPVRDRFLQAINAANIQSWEHNGPTDDELATYPDQWCGALTQGHSVKWMFSNADGGMYPIGDTWGTTQADADQVLVLAVGLYCPAQKAEVVKELRESGTY